MCLAGAGTRSAFETAKVARFAVSLACQGGTQEENREGGLFAPSAPVERVGRVVRGCRYKDKVGAAERVFAEDVGLRDVGLLEDSGSEDICGVSESLRFEDSESHVALVESAS
jgi:hypothetical protein